MAAARRIVLTSALALAGAALLAGCGTLDPQRGVTILEPLNGATVSSPFVVRFGVRGMSVVPAGDVVTNTGHHHLLIDLDSHPEGNAVPFTEKHIHLGRGQSDVMVNLPPGTYKLTAQFADGAHHSYGPAMSRSITVTVK